MPPIEQPRPTPGQEDVTPVVRRLFLDGLAERNERGIQTYGVGLQTHNGRDAGQDAWEELLDLAQYLTQLRLEHGDIRTERDAWRRRALSAEERLACASARILQDALDLAPDDPDLPDTLRISQGALETILDNVLLGADAPLGGNHARP